MTICEQDHEAVCYEEWTRFGRSMKCPACEVIKERDGLQAKVEELEAEIKDHECPEAP